MERKSNDTNVSENEIKIVWKPKHMGRLKQGHHYYAGPTIVQLEQQQKLLHFDSSLLQFQSNLFIIYPTVSIESKEFIFCDWIYIEIQPAKMDFQSGNREWARRHPYILFERSISIDLIVVNQIKCWNMIDYKYRSKCCTVSEKAGIFDRWQNNYHHLFIAVGMDICASERVS